MWAGASGDLMNFLPTGISAFQQQFRQLHFNNIGDDLENLVETSFFLA